MTDPTYYAPTGGLPPQSQLLTGRAVFKTAYAVIPKGVMSDIVTSNLPHWHGARFWILARPMSGFAETFSQYIAEVQPDGGCEDAGNRCRCAGGVVRCRRRTDPDRRRDRTHTDIRAAMPTFRPAATGRCTICRPHRSASTGSASVTKKSTAWIMPEAFVTSDRDVSPIAMPDTDGKWATTRFVEPDDVRHDMHVNIVTFEPGAVIPFLETHVMEHGLYVLEGKAVYRLNEDWVEVEAGDFMWLRAFCPQACYAGGPGKFRYLLYKDVNRHMTLGAGK